MDIHAVCLSKNSFIPPHNNLVNLYGKVLRIFESLSALTIQILAVLKTTVQKINQSNAKTLNKVLKVESTLHRWLHVCLHVWLGILGDIVCEE